MKSLHADFETRAVAELKKTGISGYTQHPATRPWCLALAGDDDAPFLWVPGQELPGDVVDFIQAGGPFWAHNVSFEFHVWNDICVPRYGFPKLHIEQCFCTMAGCYAMALPGALGKAAIALGLDVAKDQDGARLMLQMCKPRRPGKKMAEPCRRAAETCKDEACDSCYGTGQHVLWWDEPDKVKRLGEYCLQDVVVEQRLGRRVFPLSEMERKVWILDQKINARGITFDVENAKRAMQIVAIEKERLDGEMDRVTNGAVEACSQRAKLANWLEENGVDVESLAKADVVELLAMADELDPQHVAALKLRQEASKSSTAKLKAGVAGVCADGRLRDLYQYHGAGTGRFAGRRFQAHNLPRKSPEPFVFELLEAVAQCQETSWRSTDGSTIGT